MVLLEKYLQKQNSSAGIVADFSAEELDSIPIVSYPDELLQAIGEIAGKDPAVVLYELLTMKNKDEVVQVRSIEEFREAVWNRVPYIFIPEPFRSEQSRLVNSVMFEKDTLGVELGARGIANILADLIYRVQMKFSKDSPEFKELKSKLRRYHVRWQDKSGHLIYEREQRY